MLSNQGLRAFAWSMVKMTTKDFKVNGYCGPLRVVPAGPETERLESSYYSYVARYGDESGVLEGDARFRVHLVAGWAHDLVTNPRLVEAVKEVLGSEDVLCWSSDLNVKVAGRKGYYSWHQDSTYAGITPPDKVVYLLQEWQIT